jgi:stress responsive alpha/beta barrel protein
MTLQHIVLFSFPRELTEDEAAQMRAMVASWPREIGLMTRCRFGTDLTGVRTRGYGYLLYTEFPDVTAMEAYRAHPVHQRFLDWLIERNCTPLAFDYELDGQTILMPEGQETTTLPGAKARTGGEAGRTK